MIAPTERPNPYPPEEMALRGRIGAHRLHSRYPTQETTRAAHEGLWVKFLDEVDPTRILDEDERFRRARHARQAFMTQLSLKAAKARRRKAAARRNGGCCG